MIFIAGLGYAYSQERKIRLFFAKDQRQKIEKQKQKIQSSLEKNELTDVYIRDFHTYTEDFLEKEPLNPASFHFRARAYFYDLFLTGVHYDSSSLISHLNTPLIELYGNTESAKTSLEAMYRNARKAYALSDEFPESNENNLLLFLGELIQDSKYPKSIWLRYSKIPVENLEKDFHFAYTWLKIYTAVRAGLFKELTQILEENKKEDAPGKLLLTEREEDYLKGISYYYGKEYVSALNSLRNVKSDNPDSITRNAILTEARIFYLQNLQQKAMDLLSGFYETSPRNKMEIGNQIKQWLQERPNLKTNVVLDSKQVDEIDE